MRDIMLILHFIGLAMGLGTAFAHAFLGFSASKLSKDDAIKLKSNTQILGKMGNIGLVLLLVSGVYLILPYWYSLLLLPLDRKSTRLNSSHVRISYAVFCLKK